MKKKILLFATIFLLNLLVLFDTGGLSPRVYAATTSTTTTATAPKKITTTKSTSVTTTNQQKTKTATPVQKILQGVQHFVSKITQAIKSRLGAKSQKRKISRKKRVLKRPKKKITTKRSIKNATKKPVPVVKSQIQLGR